MALPRVSDYPSVQAARVAAWIPKSVTLNYGYKKGFPRPLRSLLGDVIHAYLVDLGWVRIKKRLFIHPYVSSFEAHLMVNKLFTLPIISADHSALRFVRFWPTPPSPDSRDALLINGRIVKEGRVFVPRHLLPSPPPPGWVTPSQLPPPEYLDLPDCYGPETRDPSFWLVRGGVQPNDSPASSNITP